MTALILKIIACISMLIDHTGAVLQQAGIIHFYSRVSLYYAMRVIGRLAFPIYGFLLVEGAFYTKSRPKYILRMALFALISEIPFDIAFNKSILEFGSQNVFFTLTLGLISAVAIFTAAEARGKKHFILLVAAVVAVAASAAAAHFLKTDYSEGGVIMIVLMAVITAPVKYGNISEFARRAINTAAYAAGLITLTLIVDSKIELCALAGVILIAAYNGKKGYSDSFLKYAFYVYYPAHLLTLGLIFNMKMIV